MGYIKNNSGKGGGRPVADISQTIFRGSIHYSAGAKKQNSQP